MKLGRIVTSLLENDLYKFSMGQAIYHQFSDYKTTWSFKCRNKDVHFTKEMVEEIREQIKAYCELRFTEDELSYLDGIKWIKGSYIDFLRLWKPRYEDFTITDDAIGNYIYELPAGLVDGGESVCDAAIREMHEETGLTLKITDLPIGNKGGYSSAGMTDETCTLVVGKATGEISDKYKEASEEIEVLLVDKKEAARILKEENVCIRLALVLMMFIHE